MIGQNEEDENGLRGIYVNTAGTEAYAGTLGQVSMAAASGAIIAMVKPLARDFSDRGIRVVTIAPGIIKTPLNDYFPPETTEAIATECITNPKR